MDADTPGAGVGSEPGADPSAEPSAEQLAAEGVDHLQTAAREMIAAARAFLDAIEGVVQDREQVASVVQAVTSVAEGAARAVRDVRPTGDPSTSGPGDEPGASGVEHITVT